jgi:hypothetical protein
VTSWSPESSFNPKAIVSFHAVDEVSSRVRERNIDVTPPGTVQPSKARSMRGARPGSDNLPGGERSDLQEFKTGRR